MTDRIPAQIDVDMNSLTLRETQKIEQMIGRKTGGMFRGGVQEMDSDVLAGIVAVVVQRTSPDFTFDEAMDLRLDRVNDTTTPLPAKKGTGSSSSPSSTTGRRRRSTSSPSGKPTSSPPPPATS
jgi:hypothetical protein